MGSFRDKINDKLYEAEDVEQSIENLMASFNEFREKGGTAKFILDPEEGPMCQTIITKETAEAFVKILLTVYTDMLKSIRKEINKHVDEEIRRNLEFQIKDEDGNIVDQNLSYEAALLYIDSSVGKFYVMEPMKKEDDHE